MNQKTSHHTDKMQPNKRIERGNNKGYKSLELFTLGQLFLILIIDNFNSLNNVFYVWLFLLEVVGLKNLRVENLYSLVFRKLFVMEKDKVQRYVCYYK